MKNEVIIYKNPEPNMPGNAFGYKVVIWRVDYTNFHMAEFNTIEQFARFCKKFGVLLKPRYESDSVEVFETNKTIIDSKKSFWKLSDLPKNAKPIYALSNGSIVRCFYTNTKRSVRIYRPNPNAKAIYKPFSTKRHIAHHKKYGVL